MALCRFGPHSDVYVYETRGLWTGRRTKRVFVCCMCRLASTDEFNPKDVRLLEQKELDAHIAEHRTAGHRVPGVVKPRQGRRD